PSLPVQVAVIEIRQTQSKIERVMRALFAVPYSNRCAKVICSCVLASSVSMFPGLLAHSEPKADVNDPRVVELYTEAKASEESGDIPGAISKYKAILAIAPHLGPAYNNLGALYLRQHEYPKAIAILKQGLEVDRSMPSATVLLGIACYEAAEYTEARQPLEAAVRANPKDNNAELYLAKDL